MSEGSKPTAATTLSIISGIASMIIAPFIFVEIFRRGSSATFLALILFAPIGIITIILAIFLYQGTYSRKKVAIGIIISSLLSSLMFVGIIGIIGGVLGYAWKPKVQTTTIKITEETRICQGCGITISIKHKYCPNCARKQDPLIICQKCGHQAAPDMKHCPECGNKL